jgi:hypothetical protein
MMIRNRALPSVEVACVGLLVLSCFGSVLFLGRQFAFRDFSDFYYPLYQRVQQEWAAGRLPLWSPEENGGMPLLGNPTAAVLYPGKIIYAVLPYPWAARVYVLGHVLLAFVGLRLLLRHWGVSSSGATLGAMAYAFGAPVLTQYSNVVFLVGAAWMPFGFLAADRWIRLGNLKELAFLSLILALQTLGGDPESAYLTVVASLAYAVGLAVVRDGTKRRTRLLRLLAVFLAIYVALLVLEIRSIPKPQQSGARIELDGNVMFSPSSCVLVGWAVLGSVLVVRWLRRRQSRSIEGTVLGLAGSAVLALAIAGMQLVPAVEFTGQTQRAGGSGLQDIYAYGIHPARVVEFVWPNVFGRYFGVNRNWLSALPPSHDHRIWLTSLYLGALTTSLALGAAGFRGGHPARVWLSVVAVVGLLSSLGAFGSPVFWGRTLPGVASFLGPMEYPGDGPVRPNGWLRDGDGGPYWLLATLLPGFRSFRYPGKLMVPCALALAGLAGFGWDDLAAGGGRRIKTLAQFLLTAGLFGVADSLVASGSLRKFLTDQVAMATTAFGPLEPARALFDLRWSLAQSSVMLALLLLVIRFIPRRPRLAAALALLAMSADLVVANRSHIGTVPQSVYDKQPRILEVIQESERTRPEPGPYRVYRMPNWSPIAWNLDASPNRLEEIVKWERDTLRPKYGVPYGVESTFAFGTAELLDHSLFFQPRPVWLDEQAAEDLHASVDHRVIYFPRRGFDLWNTRYFVVPTRLALGSRYRGFTSFLADTEAIFPGNRRFEGAGGPAALDRWHRDQDVQVFRNKAVFPRAWVVHQLRVSPPISGSRMADRRRVMDEILYQDDALWRDPRRQVYDPRRLAWVESEGEHARELLRSVSRAAPDPSEDVRVTTQGPLRVVLDVSLHSAGLVVLAVVDYPGWNLEIDGKPAEILRVNRAMRGALVRAGPHRLTYTYSPISVKIGAVLSLGGLIGLVVLGIVGRRTDVRSPHASNPADG